MGQGFEIGAKRFQIGAEITNGGKRDFKSGQRLQMGAREISNRGRDYKLVQNNPKSRFENSIMQLLSGCSWNKYIQKSMVNGKFFILSKFRLLQLLGMSWQWHYLFLLFICFLSNKHLGKKVDELYPFQSNGCSVGKKITSGSYTEWPCTGINLRFPILNRVINVINPHVHEKGPRGRKYFIFGDRFYSKNTRKLRFYIFLEFFLVNVYNFTWVDRIHTKL